MYGVALPRRDGRAPCGPPGSNAPRYCRWKTFSDDGGATWSPPAGEPMPMLPDPGCKGGIAAWPERKALVEVNAATTHGRVNVTLRVSLDDGAPIDDESDKSETCYWR